MDDEYVCYLCGDEISAQECWKYNGCCEDCYYELEEMDTGE